MSKPLRRLVIRHLTGALAGLNQLLGVLAADTPLPDRCEDVAFPDGGYRACTLLRSTPTYALYQEVPDAAPAR